MINNKRDLHKENMVINTKYFFIGFIIGIVPFIIVLELLSLHEGGIQYVPGIFKTTVIVFGLITSIINATTLSGIIKNYLK